jgi:hypothetical protein
MIAFDTTALSLLFVPGITVESKQDKKPLKCAKERIEALIERIAKDSDVILIPTPCLSELLVKYPTRLMRC